LAQSRDTYHLPFRCDRIDRLGGGVIVYDANTFLNVVRRRDLEVQGLECVWVLLKHRKDTILLSTFYRSL